VIHNVSNVSKRLQVYTCYGYLKMAVITRL